MPDRNKSFKVHDEGLKVIYGNVRSFKSSYRKKQYLMNNAYIEGADLIMISESGFVEGAQPYIDGYTQCGNVPKPIENLNSNYYTGGVAAWLSKESKSKVLYRDQYNHIKGLQVLKVVMDAGAEIMCFYRSPNQSKEEIEETIEFFKKIPDRTILVGDLNIPEADWITNEILKNKGCKNRNEKEDLILTLTIESDRLQKVNFATNKFNDNILDVLMVPNTKTINPIRPDPL